MSDSSRKSVSPGQLMEDILAMPEYLLRQQLLAFDTSIYVFDQNYIELHRLIEFLLNSPEGESLLLDRNADRLRRVQIDIIRRLHNFVTASLSLIDHTRRLYNRLYGADERFPEYQARVDTEFKTDPLSQFVKCLRQYCQHYKAPEIGVRVTVRPSEDGMIETKQCVLLVDDLKTFDGWNSTAKKYMNFLEEDVDILQVATLYREKVITFYRWFQSRQREIHSNELERFEAKQAECALLVFEGRVSGCLNNKEDMPYRGEEIFLGIFSADDFDAIERLPVDSSDRAELAVDTLRKYYPVSDGLRRKLLELYGEPGFFAPRMWPEEDEFHEMAP